jgi:hypothetical protein
MEACDGEAPTEASQQALLAFASDAAVPAEYRGRALVRLGHVALNSGDLGEARQRFLSAGTLSREGDHPDVTIEALKGVAITHFVEGAPATASEIAGAAIRICEEMRGKVTAPYLASAFMVDKFDLYVLGINSARHAGDPETMLARIEMMKSPAQKIPPGAIPAEIRAGTLARLRALASNPDRAAARRRRLAIWQAMMLSELPPPVRFELPKLQSRLGEDAIAITYFFFGPEVLLACLVTRDAVLAERIALPEGADLSRDIDRVSSAGNATRGLERVLGRIGRIILPESFHAALSAARKLIVCPHQSLHAVPFAALPFADGVLLDRLEVATVPCLTCLQIEAPPTPRTGLFAAASETAEGMAEPLPEVEPEAQRAAAIWTDAGAEATVLIGDGASYDRITGAQAQAAIARARVLHLGFHGSDVGTSDLMQSPMESGLHLRDRHLDGLDLSGFDMGADVVILMACHAGKRAISARGLATLPSDSIYGLQAALHTAGAQSMIGGLWEVDDEAAARIAAELHARLAEGATPAAALRAALLAYRVAAGPILDGVAFWGPVSLVAFGPRALGL